MELRAAMSNDRPKYEIQKNVPVPSVYHGRTSIYNFDQLKEPGDMLPIHAEPDEDFRKLVSRARNAVYGFKARHKEVKLATRTFRDEMVVKIYRTE